VFCRKIGCFFGSKRLKRVGLGIGIYFALCQDGFGGSVEAEELIWVMKKRG